MTDHTIVSKILVLDESLAHDQAMKQFCDANNLIGMRVSTNRLLAVLRANIDLGAIIIAENYGGSHGASHELAAMIHAMRPELPIIVRLEPGSALADLPKEIARIACGAYSPDDMGELLTILGAYVFTDEYPSAFVRGILEMTKARFESRFSTLRIDYDAPRIVRDKIIFGELFSLMALEASWCRGYMMLQTEETPMLQLIHSERAQHAPDQDRDGEPNFIDLNGELGELANLIWGAFKERYSDTPDAAPRNQTQVPILINHKQKYISFGSNKPQLSFIYHVFDAANELKLTVHQRFVFNLDWAPEHFTENLPDLENMVESGEIDFF